MSTVELIVAVSMVFIFIAFGRGWYLSYKEKQDKLHKEVAIQKKLGAFRATFLGSLLMVLTVFMF